MRRIIALLLATSIAFPAFAQQTTVVQPPFNAASPPAIGTTTPAAITGTTITATTQLIGKGTATNDNASAGQIGEYICAQVTDGAAGTQCATNTTSLVSLTTGAVANVTSISLTAGDWEVCGNDYFKVGGSTIIADALAFTSTVSAVLPANRSNNGSYTLTNAPASVGGSQVLSLSCSRYSLSSTTTVFLEGYSDFSASTLSVGGFIGARRSR